MSSEKKPIKKVSPGIAETVESPAAKLLKELDRTTDAVKSIESPAARLIKDIDRASRIGIESVESQAAKLLKDLNRATDIAKSIESPAARLIKDIDRASGMYQGLSSPAALALVARFSGGALGGFPGSASQTSVKTGELNETIEKLRREIDVKTSELLKSQMNETDRVTLIQELEGKVAELTEKAQFGFLLNRVNEIAKGLLLNSSEFRKKFIDTSQCNAYVMSVDIRRSTELMLKARSPQQFASFITTLCTELEDVVKTYFGVFDKFTGDGILAFSPDFYSGDDAGHNVIAAANRCHEIFNAMYKENRSSFTTVLTNVGLGIGIDFGPAHLVQMAGGLTVVGSPVVYACRLGGAPAGKTLLNQPAYEKISERFSEYCFFNETTLDIKSEGQILAYEVTLNSKSYQATQPDWVNSPYMLEDSPSTYQIPEKE